MDLSNILIIEASSKMPELYIVTLLYMSLCWRLSIIKQRLLL